LGSSATDINSIAVLSFDNLNLEAYQAYHKGRYYQERRTVKDIKRSRDVLPQGKELARKAIELDDSLAEAHTSLAGILTNLDWDWAGAEREYKRAIELNPNYPLAHGWYGGFLVAMGRIEEAIAELKIAQELDPLSPFPYSLGVYLTFRKEYDTALEMLEKGLELDNMLYLWIHDTRLDPLRSDPRFQSLVSQMNLPD
jgi:tetratricopeptide (TPR) repeat protein